MPESKERQPIPNVTSDHLLLTRFHDTRSITPLHVSVIDAIADVIGVDPTKNSLNLSYYASIAAIDSLIKRDEDEAYEHAVIAFYYREGDANLLVICRSMGEVLVFDGEECQDVEW